MMKYNTQKRPDPDRWLSLGEDERLELIITCHERIGDDLPNVRLHAAIHTVVENQITLKEEAPIQAMRRLRMEGLDRHDAVRKVHPGLLNFEQYLRKASWENLDVSLS